jgi:hypothetical protein
MWHPSVLLVLVQLRLRYVVASGSVFCSTRGEVVALGSLGRSPVSQQSNRSA